MRVLGTFLFGSQNYNLDNKDSDEDYKVIVMPEWEDLYYGRKLDSKKDEHNQVWDVRTFFTQVLKANHNALELLFSVKQNFYDEDFENFVNMLRANVGWIIANNRQGYYHSLHGNAIQSYKRDPLSRKQVSRAIYLIHLLELTMNDNFSMTNYTWRSRGYTFAREVRYLDSVPIPSFEEIEEDFAAIYTNPIWRLEPTENQKEFYKTLTYKMEQFVKNKIK